jgi:hypothetical protein
MSELTDHRNILDGILDEERMNFERHQKMYQPPGVSFEILKGGFEKWYFPSLEKYYRSLGDLNSKEKFQNHMVDLNYANDIHNEKDTLKIIKEYIIEENIEAQLDLLMWTINVNNNEKIKITLLRKLLNLSTNTVVLIQSIKYSAEVDFEEKQRLVTNLLGHSDANVIVSILNDIDYFGWTFHQQNEILEKFLNDRRSIVRAIASEKFFLNIGDDAKREIFSKKYTATLDSNASVIEKMVWVRMKIKLKQSEQEAKKEFVKIFIELCERYNIWLYQYHQLDDIDNFKFREIYPKSGGRIDTLGNEFVNKVINRYLHPINFAHWRMAYESAEAWKKNGFDYVPIEPIYGFKYSNKYTNLMEVKTGVLGMNISEYKKLGFNKMYDIEINSQIQRIEKTLKTDLNIDFTKHASGHWHYENFCLRWERLDNSNEDSPINWEKPPRVYLIDWDHAGELD